MRAAENLLLTAKGRNGDIRVMDFGLAKLRSASLQPLMQSRDHTLPHNILWCVCLCRMRARLSGPRDVRQRACASSSSKTYRISLDWCY